MFPSFPTNLGEICYWQFHNLFSIHIQTFCETHWNSIHQAPTNFFQTLHPSISAWTTHGLPLITSPSKMTTVLIRRNAPNDRCHNLTALMPRCTKIKFLLTPHYICVDRNLDNLHNAAFIEYSVRGMADVHLLVVLRQIERGGCGWSTMERTYPQSYSAVLELYVYNRE